MDGGVDYAYASAVHETAHQWWGHQVSPSNAQGALFIAEGLAEYTNIAVLEKKYGQKKLKTYLEDELEKYLFRRTKDAKGEQPLMYGNPHQTYIHAN